MDPSWQEPALAEPRASYTGYPIESLPPAKLLSKQSKPKTKNIIRLQSFMSSEPGSGEEQQSSGPEAFDIESPSSEGEIHRSSGASPSASYDIKVEDGASTTVLISPKLSGNSLTPPPEQKFKEHLKTNEYDALVEDSSIRRRSSRHSNSLGFNYYEKAKESLGIPLRRRAHTPTSDAYEGGQDTAGSHPPLKKIKITFSPKKPRADSNSVTYKQGTPEIVRTPRQAAPTSLGEDQIINNDYCNACGGPGKFLCCETCPNSFHFTCLDPPMDESDLPNGEWQCRECYTKRNPQLPYQKGLLFSKLLNQIERRNPRQFQLPKKLRERYEGVSTGPEGEYVDQVKPQGRSKPHNREAEDALKIFDKNGEPALCFKCKKSALDGNQIVTCDFCSSHWHIDCVQPPLYGVGPSWKCPNHADQAAVLPRKPKKVKLVDTDLRRGFRNNGNIEVFDAEEEEDGNLVQPIPFFEVSDSRNGVSAPLSKTVERIFSMDDIVHRLPADGIKLDFIEAVYQQNLDPYEETRTADILVALDELASRPYEDRMIVRDLSFLQMSGSKHVSAAQAKANLSTLLDAALYDHEASETSKAFTGVEGKIIKREPQDLDIDMKDTEQVSVSEVGQLLAIKRLMKIKGKDAFMDFLTK